MLVNYLLELVLLDYNLITVLPSVRVAAATYLARATLRRGNEYGQIWTETLRHYTTYDVKDIKDVVKKIHRIHHEAEEGTLKSVFNKYKTQAFLRVSLITVLSAEELTFNDIDCSN